MYRSFLSSCTPYLLEHGPPKVALIRHNWVVPDLGARCTRCTETVVLAVTKSTLCVVHRVRASVLLAFCVVVFVRT